MAGCIDCGQPPNRGGVRCPDCAKRRQRMQAVAANARWRTRVNPAPAPVPQLRRRLPPLGVLLTSDDGERVQCHGCGRWYRSLAQHLIRHGFASAAEYRERYGLARTLALCSPQVSAIQRQRATERDQAKAARPFSAENPAPQTFDRTARLSTRIARGGRNG